jgi:hypothetical protein
MHTSVAKAFLLTLAVSGAGICSAAGLSLDATMDERSARHVDPFRIWRVSRKLDCDNETIPTALDHDAASSSSTAGSQMRSASFW